MTLFEINMNYHSRISFENFFDERIKFIFARNNVKHMSELMFVFEFNLFAAQNQ